jgi:UDP-N-acetylglucosamine 2-epimerase
MRSLVRRVVGYATGTRSLKIPAGVAQSRCDRIYVMGKRVKAALVSEGIPEQRVEATGSPRFAPLFTAADGLRPGCPDAERPVRLLYVTGSYSWHGFHDLARHQRDQVREIVNTVAHWNKFPIQLAVRIHPRERLAEYDWLRARPDVRIVESTEDLYRSLVNSHIVVSNRSTAMYEAVLLKRLAVLVRFSEHRDLMTDAMSKDLVTVSNASEVLAVASSTRGAPARYRSLLRVEQTATAEVVDPATPRAAERIAAGIVADLCAK